MIHEVIMASAPKGLIVCFSKHSLSLPEHVNKFIKFPKQDSFVFPDKRANPMRTFFRISEVGCIRVERNPNRDQDVKAVTGGRH